MERIENPGPWMGLPVLFVSIGLAYLPWWYSGDHEGDGAYVVASWVLVWVSMAVHTPVMLAAAMVVRGKHPSISTLLAIGSPSIAATAIAVMIFGNLTLTMVLIAIWAGICTVGALWFLVTELRYPQ